MSTPPDLPQPSRAAYLLDLDGTLLDIAPAPDRVVVPPTLPDDLRRLRKQCGDALAVVTGRPVAQVDALLGDAPFAVAGEHGAALRLSPDSEITMRALPPVPEAWWAAARALAAAHPGAAVEPKSHGLVVHYRAAPEAGAALRAGLERLLAGGHVLLAAKMAWELRPVGVDKGAAVRALMSAPPFAGRVPVFVGDDVTDEDGISAAQALGGVGLRVAEAFGEPADVRAWIKKQSSLEETNGKTSFV